jgi:signal transduction histidine kinase
MLVAADPGDPRLPAAIERAHQLGKSGLDEARRAIGMLRDDELPGPELLAGLAAQFEEISGVPCQFAVHGQSHELPADARLAVYRVTQEALTNITRHARTERVEVHLRYEDRDIWLTVENFAASGAAQVSDGTSGYGLTGMRERAELLGGELSAARTAAGYRVDLRVPA